jgi:methionyl-tRNA formyltransferase
VARGFAESGVTLMQMDEGLDTGDVLLQKRVSVAPDETGESLLARLGPLGAEALREGLPKLAELPHVPQDHARATLAPILSREDGKLDFTQPAAVLDARRRGFTPWPGAWTTVAGAVLKIHAAAPLAVGGSAQPGELLAGGLVACAPGTALRLDEVQPEGKKRMSASVWLQGARLKPGDRLGG